MRYAGQAHLQRCPRCGLRGSHTIECTLTRPPTLTLEGLMEPAGPVWVSRYPTSRSVTDLAEPFQGNVVRFFAELGARGCTVVIAATRRPEQRAWLMQKAWDISKGADPATIPARPDIPILWTLDGARAMVAAYGLVVRPSLASRHISGNAIDCKILGWTGTGEELFALGASYGVHKLRSDAPHWSSDGH